MTLGLHETRSRRRRRGRWIIAKWVIVLSVIVGAGVFAYETGLSLAQRSVILRDQKIVELNAEIETLRRQNAKLDVGLRSERKRLGEARARYETDVPSGKIASLLGRVRDKLEEGVNPARLEFVIAAAQNPRTCDEKPVTKRFLVQTPLQKGANDSVSFAGNAITVTAEGVPAQDAQGRVEAWFDPAQPITLQLAQLGGKTARASGKLPLHASVVVGDSEYRYSLVAGAQRGFVQVTGDRCSYP